jgi:hypothetical protein
MLTLLELALIVATEDWRVALLLALFTIVVVANAAFLGMVLQVAWAVLLSLRETEAQP